MATILRGDKIRTIRPPSDATLYWHFARNMPCHFLPCDDDDLQGQVAYWRAEARAGRIVIDVANHTDGRQHNGVTYYSLCVQRYKDGAFDEDGNPDVDPLSLFVFGFHVAGECYWFPDRDSRDAVTRAVMGGDAETKGNPADATADAAPAVPTDAKAASAAASAPSAPTDAKATPTRADTVKAWLMEPGCDAIRVIQIRRRMRLEDFYRVLDVTHIESQSFEDATGAVYVMYFDSNGGRADGYINRDGNHVRKPVNACAKRLMRGLPLLWGDVRGRVIVCRVKDMGTLQERCADMDIGVKAWKRAFKAALS